MSDNYGRGIPQEDITDRIYRCAASIVRDSTASKSGEKLYQGTHHGIGLAVKAYTQGIQRGTIEVSSGVERVTLKPVLEGGQIKKVNVASGKLSSTLVQLIEKAARI